jgi:AcrR family transcriptional regulator
MTNAEAAERPASRKRAQTVARLLEAANAVIAEKGFQRASLDEIAAQAGMTKGAIYSNFGSKEDLFLAVVASRPLGFSANAQQSRSIRENFREIGQDCAAMLHTARAHAAFQAEFLLYALTHEEMRSRVAARYAAKFNPPPPPAGVDEYLKATGRPSYREYLLIMQALSVGFTFQHALTPDLITDEIVVKAFEALAGRPDEPRSPTKPGS